MKTLPVSDMTHLSEESVPGRSCPLSYQYGPDVFREASLAPDLRSLDTLYVAGGVYGNHLALQETLRMFGQEPGSKRLVFNGDFHWFDRERGLFSRIQETVLEHRALRGNVETELSCITEASEAGCGCAYPEWVDDAVVSRSNNIIQSLGQITTARERQQLAELPMWLLAQVGSSRIGIVHGDAQSLAGWGFSQENLKDTEQKNTIKSWFDSAQVDIFASTHTCLPVIQQFRSLSGSDSVERWVINNGATGLPNVRGHGCGLLTRISTIPPLANTSLTGVRFKGLFLDAIRVEIPQQQFEDQFIAMWPPGSDAYASYFSRIHTGTDYAVEQVVRYD